MLILAEVSDWLVYTGVIFFTLVALLLIGVVLIQKPRGGGLSGAFGGAGGGGGSQAVFGARAGDVVTWVTVGVFAVFLLMGVLMVYATDQETDGQETLAEAVQNTSEQLREQELEELNRVNEETQNNADTPEQPVNDGPATTQDADVTELGDNITTTAPGE